MSRETEQLKQFGLNGGALWRSTWIFASLLVAGGVLFRVVFTGTEPTPWWVLPRGLVPCALFLWCLGGIGPLFRRIIVVETNSTSLKIYIGPLWNRRVFRIPWESIRQAGIADRTVRQWVGGRWPTTAPVEFEVPQLALQIEADAVPDLVQYAGKRRKGWVEGVEVTAESAAAILWITQATAGGYPALLAEISKHIPDKIIETSLIRQASSKAIKFTDLIITATSLIAGSVIARNLLSG